MSHYKMIIETAFPGAKKFSTPDGVKPPKRDPHLTGRWAKAIGSVTNNINALRFTFDADDCVHANHCFRDIMSKIDRINYRRSNSGNEILLNQYRAGIESTYYNMIVKCNGIKNYYNRMKKDIDTVSAKPLDELGIDKNGAFICHQYRANPSDTVYIGLHFVRIDDDE